MAKSENQKAKLLYIIQCLKENTDENHDITTPKLIEYLKSNDINADRKTIYNDIDTLNDAGFDIVRNPGPRGGYYLAQRDFELAEVKLLVDLVQSSKFITAKKSYELIKKLQNQVSRYEAQGLQRQVIVLDRNKTANENIYYSVDVIYEAIRNDVKIEFNYYEWGVDKKPHLKKEGAVYCVSPWLLNWDDENYYLVAFDDETGIMKYYRVDKMLHIKLSTQPRSGKDIYEQMDAASFSKKTFGMFYGAEKTVLLICTNKLTGVIIDRFGQDVAIRKYDDQHIIARVKVAVSPQFFGWVCGLGTGVKIQSPQEVQDQYTNYLQQILTGYDI